MSGSRTRLALGVVAVFGLALAVRVWVTMSTYQYLDLGFTDNAFYHEQANALADGLGFTHPFELRKGLRVPAADHPPLFSLALAVPSVLGFDTPLAHRLAACVISATGALVVMWAAGRFAGRTAGVLAGLVAALSPHLWMNDGLILSESLLFPMVALVLGLAWAYQERPSVTDAAVLGGAVGLAALTRSETALLTATLIFPIVAWRRRHEPRTGLFELGGAAVAFVLVIAPWVIRNQVHFTEPVIFSYGTGFVLELANCDATYSGQFLGYWSEDCAPSTEAWPEGDLSVVELEKRERAMAYIGDHLDEQPKVVGARVGRMFGLFRIDQTRSFDIFFERRGADHVTAGFWSWYVQAPLAIVGFALAGRRKGWSAAVPAVAMVVIVSVAAGMSFGITRYRVPVDVAVAIGAALALDQLLARIRRVAPRPDGRIEPAGPTAAAVHADGEPTVELRGSSR